MKKYFKITMSILMSAILVISLASCNSSEKDTDAKIKNTVDAYYENMKNSIDEGDSYSDIASRIKKYLDREGFKTRVFSKESIVVYVNRKENSANNEKRIFNISFSKETAKGSSQAIATILGVLKNSEKNGDIKVMITPVRDGYKYGLESIPKKEFAGYDFINLISSKDTDTAISSPKTEVFKISKKAVKNKPKGEIAYRIGIKGLMKEDSGNRSEKHANPITNLGGILLRAKNADINIEIVNFSSTGDISKYPYEGFVEVVIEKGSQEKFEERLKNAKEDFLKKNKKLNPDVTFDYEQIEMPKKVYSYGATMDILSLIYTLEDGIFMTTERDYKGDIEALDTIANIRTENNKLELSIMARAVSDEAMDSMRENFKMTSGILGFSMQSEERATTWKKRSEEYWKKSGIYDVLGKNTDQNKELFVESPGSYVAGKFTDLNVAEVRFNFDKLKDVARGLKKFVEENTKTKDK